MDQELKAVQALIPEVLLYSRIDELPETVLDLLSWQLHVDFWTPDLEIEKKRALIKGSIGWHRRKGTIRAIKKVLEALGHEAEIIPYHAAREQYDLYGGARLDGTWRLNGSKQLAPFYRLAGVPYLSHWAEFAVKVNLADATRPNWNREIRWAVDIGKNARSWPVYYFWLGLEILVDPTFYCFLSLKKEIEQPYPWCTPRLDGTWRVGVDRVYHSLDGRALDGSWTVGGFIPARSYETIRQCNIYCRLTMKKEIERPAAYIINRLGEGMLTVNGAWKLGRNPIMALARLALAKTLEVNGRPSWGLVHKSASDLNYPANPSRIGKLNKLNPHLHLDGSWSLGQATRPVNLDGSWRIRRRPGIRTEANFKSKNYWTFGPAGKLARANYRLGQSWSRRLDGSWRVGAYNNLDGTWRLDGSKYLAAPRMGRHFRRVNGQWSLGYNKQLDGSWKIGFTGPTCQADLIIRKAA